MAIAYENIHLFLSTPYTQLGDVQPEKALGGFFSGRLAYRQYTLSGALSDAVTIQDNTFLSDTPGGGAVDTTPLENSGAYTAASSLVHWWRLGRTRPELAGLDSARVTTQVAFTTFRQSLTGSNVSIDQPGNFKHARRALDFNGAGQAIALPTATANWNLANAWTISLWLKTDIITGISTAFHLSNNTGTVDTVNMISIKRDTSQLFVRIADQTTSANQKERFYNGIFSVDTWVYVTVRWDGTTLDVFMNGVKQTAASSPEDDSVTMANASRVGTLGALASGATSPTESWDGRIHSIMAWNTALSDANVAASYILGDGPTPLDNYSHANKWVLFVSGNNRGEARRILSHDGGTGTLLLAEPLPSLGAANDAWRLCGPDDIWDDGPTALECAEGVVDHRALYVNQNSSETLLDSRYYLTPLDPGALGLEVVASNLLKTSATSIPSIAVDTDEPDITTFSPTTTSFASRPQQFQSVRSFAAAEDHPDTGAGTFSLTNTSRNPIWLRRTTPELTKRYRGSVWLLMLEAANGSVTPGPIFVPFLIVSHPLGFTPAFVAQFDRVPRCFGGANVVAQVLDVGGTPVQAAQLLAFSLQTGPGALVQVPPAELLTDANGQARAIYTAPEDDADTGETVTVRARLAGDPA